MQTTLDIDRMGVGGRSAVLMARLVHRDGALVRPADVIAIEYSIYELDAWPPNCFTPIDEHEYVQLPIGEVLFDSLQTGRMWALDCVGYNFRHAIAFDRGPSGRIRRAGADYEVKYQITPASGPQTVVRFHLRGICDERQ